MASSFSRGSSVFTCLRQSGGSHVVLASSYASRIALQCAFIQSLAQSPTVFSSRSARRFRLVISSNERSITTSHTHFGVIVPCSFVFIVLLYPICRISQVLFL